MPTVLVYVIHSRALCVLLLAERISMGAGLGLLIGDVIGAFLFPRNGTLPAMVLGFLGLAYVALGLWLPMHRRHGFARSDWIMYEE